MRAGVVQVLEGRRISPNLGVTENVEVGSYARGRANRARHLDHVSTIFPRPKERTMPKAGTMSGGDQQMLAIGRGLMATLRWPILDEPSLGLSPLRAVANVGPSRDIAARAHVLETGSLRLAGAPAGLLASSALKRACLGVWA